MLNWLTVWAGGRTVRTRNIPATTNDSGLYSSNSAKFLFYAGLTWWGKTLFCQLCQALLRKSLFLWWWWKVFCSSSYCKQLFFKSNPWKFKWFIMIGWFSRHPEVLTFISFILNNTKRLLNFWTHVCLLFSYNDAAEQIDEQSSMLWAEDCSLSFSHLFSPEPFNTYSLFIQLFTAEGHLNKMHGC